MSVAYIIGLVFDLMEYAPSPALFEAATYLSSAPSLAKVSNTTRLEVEQVRYLGDYKLLTAWVDSCTDYTNTLPSHRRPRIGVRRCSI